MKQLTFHYLRDNNAWIWTSLLDQETKSIRFPFCEDNRDDIGKDIVHLLPHHDGRKLVRPAAEKTSSICRLPPF